MAVDWYYLLQKVRIGIENGIRCLRRDYGESYGAREAELDAKTFVEPLATQEKAFSRYCREAVANEPIAQWMVKTVKGVSWVLASQLIGIIGSIERFPNIAKLWAYSGLAPDSRRESGRRLRHNPALKRLMFNVCTCFLKSGGYYAEIYARFRKYEADRFARLMRCLKEELESAAGVDGVAILGKIRAEEPREEEIRRLNRELKLRIQAVKASGEAPPKGSPRIMSYAKFVYWVFRAACLLGFEPPPQITRENRFKVLDAASKFLTERYGGKGFVALRPNHRHLRAMRKTAKVFLQHVWLEWRKLENLPVTEPYAFAILGHDRSGYIPPPESKDAEFVA
jgi:hypothetical protein